MIRNDPNELVGGSEGERRCDDASRRELRQRIDKAKARLPLPDLMELVDDGDHAHSSACCPFHDDEHPSFSIYQTEKGHWRWKCFADCGGGDEINYLATREDMELGDAIQEYLGLAEEYGAESKDTEQPNGEDDEDNY